MTYSTLEIWKVGPDYMEAIDAVVGPDSMEAIDAVVGPLDAVVGPLDAVVGPLDAVVGPFDAVATAEWQGGCLPHKPCNSEALTSAFTLWAGS